MVNEIKSSELKLIMEGKKENLFVVDCYAPWCKFCKMLEPIFSQVSEDFKNSNVEFYKINTDENLDFAEENDVMSLPTILIIKDGKVINRKSGFVNAQDLKSLIKG